MKKLLLIMCMAAALLLVSCSSGAPEIDSVKDDFISLIEASGEVNDILFGEGISVYEREDVENGPIYDNLPAALDTYEALREDCGYSTIEEIKEKCRLVYSEAYLESVFKPVFEGYADEESGVSEAKYLEWDNRLYKNMYYESFLDGQRTYDYESMKTVKPSEENYVNIVIDSYLDGEKMTLNLAFSKTDKEWRLDTPTY